MATKNKGELSEFYTFVYILGNGIVPLVDGKLQFLGRQLDFKAVYRKEETIDSCGCKSDVSNEYRLDSDKDFVLVKKFGERIGQVPKSVLRERAAELLRLAQSDEEVHDDNDVIRQLKEILVTDNLSAKSADKSDFTGDVTTAGVPGVQRLGFSVKSNLGSNSTLINANKENSAFRYEILKDGRSLTEDEISELLSFNASSSTTSLVMKAGYSLCFIEARGSALDYNLRLMDSLGPEIIAAMLVERFFCKHASDPISTVIGRICCDERSKFYPAISRLGTTPQEREAVLSFKIKNILLGFTTGATVSNKWDGQDEANGGFIVVKKDGAVVCLELFTRNAIGQYLIDWCFFDNPSRSRHGHNRVLIENGRAFIDLQLLVRFKTSLSR